MIGISRVLVISCFICFIKTEVTLCLKTNIKRNLENTGLCDRNNNRATNFILPITLNRCVRDPPTSFDLHTQRRAKCYFNF